MATTTPDRGTAPTAGSRPVFLPVRRDAAYRDGSFRRRTGRIGHASGMDPTGSATARYASLARLLLRYGRSDLVRGAGLDEFTGSPESPAADTGTAEALAADLERMGPTYTKLGQLLSTRSDLLPAPYTEALSRLQDEVAPFPYEQVEEIIASEFGVGVRHLYDHFDPEPLATASLGQVHRARMVGGREVVVKVQRPDARDIIRGDMETLRKLADLADRGTSAGR